MSGRRPSIASIQAAVAGEFGVPCSIMTAEAVDRASAHPRQVAMALALQLTGRSSVVVGRHFGGRDHSTVLFARSQVALRRGHDRELDLRIRRLEVALGTQPCPATPTNRQFAFLHGPLFDLAALELCP